MELLKNCLAIAVLATACNAGGVADRALISGIDDGVVQFFKQNDYNIVQIMDYLGKMDRPAEKPVRYF